MLVPTRPTTSLLGPLILRGIFPLRSLPSYLITTRFVRILHMRFRRSRTTLSSRSCRLSSSRLDFRNMEAGPATSSQFSFTLLDRSWSRQERGDDRDQEHDGRKPDEEAEPWLGWSASGALGSSDDENYSGRSGVFVECPAWWIQAGLRPEISLPEAQTISHARSSCASPALTGRRSGARRTRSKARSRGEP
jgi:hypothetical protein